MACLCLPFSVRDIQLLGQGCVWGGLSRQGDTSLGEGGEGRIQRHSCRAVCDRGGDRWKPGRCPGYGYYPCHSMMSVYWGTSNVNEETQCAPRRPQGPLVPTELQALTQWDPLPQMETTEPSALKMSVIKEGILYFMKLDEERWPRSHLHGPSS